MKKLITENTFADPCELPEHWAMYIATMAQTLAEFAGGYDKDEWEAMTDDDRTNKVITTMTTIAKMTATIYNLKYS